MYEPNHRSSADLIKTSQYLDFVAKGTYANHVGMQNKRTWVRWSVEQAVEAASQSSSIPVAVLWMARDQETPEDIAAIRKWTRHDVYLSLVTGAKGIIVWSGFNKRRGFRRHFKDFYEGYLSAAHELNIDPGLGRVFLRGITETDITANVMHGPATQRFRYRDKKYTYPTVSIKQLRLDNQHYLFVVNSANEACRVQLTGLPRQSRHPECPDQTGQQLLPTVRLAWRPTMSRYLPGHTTKPNQTKPPSANTCANCSQTIDGCSRDRKVVNNRRSTGNCTQAKTGFRIQRHNNCIARINIL